MDVRFFEESPRIISSNMLPLSVMHIGIRVKRPAVFWELKNGLCQQVFVNCIQSSAVLELLLPDRQTEAGGESDRIVF